MEEGPESTQSQPTCCDPPNENYCMTFRLEETVLIKIWRSMFFIISYTTGVVCLHNYVDNLRMNFPMFLVPVLGVVTGLLLVFRTNTAYDRFWEGRKLWSTVHSKIRALTMCIWVGVDAENSNLADLKKSEIIVEKISAINLLVAYVYATKHYLRGEYGYDEGDMKEFINHLGSHKIYQRIPQSTSRLRRPKRSHLMAYDYITPSNVPLDVCYHLFSYIKSIGARGSLDRHLVRDMEKAVMVLVECLTEFERIQRTPMPFAYSVHLSYTVWLFLLSLPYQFVGQLNWYTIPAVALSSFSLLGILAIGTEIENPFGKQADDLPLDDYCKVIHREIQLIVSTTMPTMKEWVLSTDNRPFVPMSWLGAQELSKKSSDELKQLLTMGAQLPWDFPVF